MSASSKDYFGDGNRWKQSTFLLLLLACALVLPACGVDQIPPEPEEGVLIYAALNPVSKELTGYINAFNNNHEDVQIEIRDYSDEGGRERLLTELTLGRVPDIMEMHYYGKDGPAVGPNTREYHGYNGYHFGYVVPGSYANPADEYWMPYQHMAQKGYLEDLWPYIENDPDLGRDGVLQASLEAAEVNGGLYMLFQRVVIFTLIGRESVVGERYSWTLDELMETLSDMPEGSTIMRYNTTRQVMFFNLLRFSLDRYVDRETGTCSFDGKEFRDLVTFLEGFPEEVDYEDPKEASEEVIRQIKYKKQMLEGMMVTWPREIGFSDAIFQERAAFPGYPTADDSSGSFFYAAGEILAMSSSCQNKEAAWDYIRELIKPRRSKSEPLSPAMCIPVNLHDYELLIWGELQSAKDHARKYPDNPVEYFVTRGHFDYAPEIPLMHLLAEEDTQRFMELVNHTTQLYWPDDDLTDIVWDVLGAYFAGDRTMDQAVQMLNNRVGLYLKEAM